MSEVPRIREQIQTKAENMDLTFLFFAVGFCCFVSLLSAQEAKAVVTSHGGGQAGPAYKVGNNQGSVGQNGPKSKKRIRRPLVPTTTPPVPTITTKLPTAPNTTDYYYYYYDVTTENTTDYYYYYNDVTTGATTTTTTRPTTTQPPPPQQGNKRQRWKKQNQGQPLKKQQQQQQQQQPQQQQQQQKHGQQQGKHSQNKPNQQNNLKQNKPLQKQQQQQQQRPKQNQGNQNQQLKQQQPQKQQQMKKASNKSQQQNKQWQNKNQLYKNQGQGQGQGQNQVLEVHSSTLEPTQSPSPGNVQNQGHGKGQQQPQQQKETTTGSPYATVTPYYLRTTQTFVKTAVTTPPTGDVCFSTQDCEVGCCYNRQNQLLDVDNYGPGGPKEGRDTGRCKPKAPRQGEACDDFCMCDEAAGFVCYRRYVPDMKEALKMSQNPQYEGPEFPVLPPRKCTNSTFVMAERQSFWKCYFDVACSGGIEASGGAA